MESYIFSVEAFDDGFWKTIAVFTGTKGSDQEQKAKDVYNEWIEKGWPKDKIGINSSKFSSRTRDIQG